MGMVFDKQEIFTVRFFDVGLTSFLKSFAEYVYTRVYNFINNLCSKLAEARLDCVKHSQ